MTQKDRTEIRDIIHGILEGWQEATVQRENLIHTSLNRIDKHLETLNGTVVEHGKIIAKNLPHTVLHCPQAAVIKEMKENQLTEKAIRKFMYTGVAILSALAGILWAITEIFFK